MAKKKNTKEQLMKELEELKKKADQGIVVKEYSGDEFIGMLRNLDERLHGKKSK